MAEDLEESSHMVSEAGNGSGKEEFLYICGKSVPLVRCDCS